MASANNTGTHTSNRNAGPAEDLDEKFSLPPIRPRFDPKLMSGHSTELGRAGELLSQAYAITSAVSTLASIARRSQIARDLGNEYLSPSEEDHLLSAAAMLSHELSETLCKAADRFDNELEGGE